MSEFLQKALAIIEPAALLIVTALVGLAVAKVTQWCNDQRSKAAVSEAVAAVAQTMPGPGRGAEKFDAAKTILEADPRVKTVSDTAIEAAVHVLPAKPCEPEKEKEQ